MKNSHGSPGQAKQKLQKLQKLQARLLRDELHLKQSALYAHRYPLYAIGLAEAVSRDHQLLWEELQSIKKQINEMHP
jgi:hypothetical protein